MILVTGATGFVGSALIQTLIDSKEYTLKIATRRKVSNLPENIMQTLIDDLNGDMNWEDTLKNIDVVIHTVARVHIMDDKADDPLNEFRKTNVEGTLNLAEQAVHAGVRRFIYLSSIKVNGESTPLNKPFTADDIANPTDDYALSKYEAETGLLKIANNSNLEVVIIRPPLIYGIDVKANFRRMINWLKKGIPLPLGGINNKRSLVSLDNLIDLIVLCIKHSGARNQVFLVSDGKDMSTPELLKSIGNALGKRVYLLKIPEFVLQNILLLIGKQAIAKRLCGSLQVDISKNNELLDWRPPFPVDESFVKAVTVDAK